MTLTEISLGYQDSAEALRLRLCQLRAERRRCRTPRQVKAMDRRIRTLTPLLRSTCITSSGRAGRSGRGWHRAR